MNLDDVDAARIFDITDGFIAHGDPESVAFWLGYRHGIKHRLIVIENNFACEERLRFLDVAGRGHGGKFIDAYAHGYRDGIDGKQLQEILADRQEAAGPRGVGR